MERTPSSIQKEEFRKTLKSTLDGFLQENPSNIKKLAEHLDISEQEIQYASDNYTFVDLITFSQIGTAIETLRKKMEINIQDQMKSAREKRNQENAQLVRSIRDKIMNYLQMFSEDGLEKLATKCGKTQQEVLNILGNTKIKGLELLQLNNALEEIMSNIKSTNFDPNIPSNAGDAVPFEDGVETDFTTTSQPQIIGDAEPYEDPTTMLATIKEYTKDNKTAIFTIEQFSGLTTEEIVNIINGQTIKVSDLNTIYGVVATCIMAERDVKAYNAK